MHSGGAGGYKTGFAIFKNEATRWLDAEQAGSPEEYLRRRLAKGDLVGTDEHLEIVRHSDMFCCSSHDFGEAPGRDGKLAIEAKSLHHFYNGRNRLNFIEKLRKERFLLLGDFLDWQVVQEIPIEPGNNFPGRDTAHGIKLFLGKTTGQPRVPPDRLGPGVKMSGHAVGQRAVEIKDKAVVVVKIQMFHNQVR